MSGTTNAVIQKIHDLVIQKRPQIIGAKNVHLLVLCNGNKKLADFYNQCSIVTVDGIKHSSVSVNSMARVRLPPSTRTFTVPSGNFSS